MVPPLPVQQVDTDVYVAAQLDPAAMSTAAAMGFRSVINNRPDHEHGPGQPENRDIEAAALAAGLAYRFLPVAGGYQSTEEIGEFARLLEELPKPILAFCRSGSRSARLVAAARALG